MLLPYGWEELIEVQLVVVCLLLVMETSGLVGKVVGPVGRLAVPYFLYPFDPIFHLCLVV